MDVSAELITEQGPVHGRTYTEFELEDLLEKAYNIESMERHGKGNREICMIGTLLWRNRLYDIYMDSNGECWYSVRIVTDRGIVSEYEAIFGREQKRLRMGVESGTENLQ